MLLDLLKKAGSKIINKLDRDKSMPGFQLAPGGWQGVKQRVTNDPGGYSFTRPLSSIGQYGVPGQAMRGALSLTPFTSLGNLDPVSRSNYQATAPQTPAEKSAELVGKWAYGSALTAPIMGSSAATMLGGTMKNTLIGSGFGAGAAGVNALLNKRLPTASELGQGAVQGASNSWVYPATNAITDSLLKGAAQAIPASAKYLKPLTDAGLRKSGDWFRDTAKQGVDKLLKTGVKKVAPQLLKGGVRDAAETPLETAYFASQDEGGSYSDRYKQRFLSDLISNFGIGALRQGVGIGKAGVSSQKIDPSVSITQPKPPTDPLEALKARGTPEVIKGNYWRFETTGTEKGNVRFFSKQKDYVDEYKYVKERGGKSGKIIQEKIELKNPLIVKAEGNKFSDPSFEKKYIQQAIDNGNDSVVFRNGDDEFIAKIGYNQSQPKPPTDGVEVPSKLQEIQNKLIQKAKLAPEFIDSGLPKQKTKAEINQDATKYLSGKVDSNIIDEYIAKGYSPSQIRSVLKNVPQATYSKLAENPEYTRNYFDKMLASSKVEPIKQQVKINQPIKPSSDFLEVVSKAKNPEDVESIKQFLPKYLSSLEQSLSKPFDKVVADLESGVSSKDTQKLENFFKVFRTKAESLGNTMGNIKDYFTHITKERALNIIQNGAEPDTFGSILSTPYFAKKRTGKLQDYDKSTLALQAYALEATKNLSLSPVKAQEVKIANDIKNEYIKSADDPLRRMGVWQKGVDVVKKLEPISTKSVDYDAPQKEGYQVLFGSAFRSNADRAMMVGQKFYDAFYKPVNDAQINTMKYMQSLIKTGDADLAKLYSVEIGSGKASRDEMIARLYMKESRYEYKKANDAFMENVKNANFKQAYLAQLVNDIHKDSLAFSVRNDVATEKVLAFVRSMTGRGGIGINLASAINNLFETKRIFSTTSTKHFLTGLKRMIAGEDLRAKYGRESTYSTALERGGVFKKNLGQKVIDKMDNALFFMFDKSESFKDKWFLASLEEQAKSKGLKGYDLERYVIQKFDQYAIKYGKGQDIGIYKSPLIKTIGQFGQYAIKDVAIFTDKVAGASKGDVGDMKYVAKYALASTAQVAAFKAMLGVLGFGNQTGTAIDLFNDLFTKGVPISPAADLVLQLFTDITDELSGTELEEFERQQKDKAMKRNIATFTIPGSNQLVFKSGLQSMLNSETVDKVLPFGTMYYQKMGYHPNWKGNVAHQVSEPGTAGFAKSFFFGPSYDPKRQEYIDRLKGRQGTGIATGLNTNQSQVYKELPNDQRDSFYKQVTSNLDQSLAQKKEIDSILEPKKPTLLENLFGKKEQEQVGTPVQSATAQQIKDYNSGTYSLIDAGVVPSQERLAYTYFRTNSPTSNDLSKRAKGFEQLNKLMSNEDYSDEQKEAILKASGVKMDAYAYYRDATRDMYEKRQILMDLIGDKKGGEMTQLLYQLRRSVGGKQFLVSGDIDYLYDRGWISKQDKKLLEAVKFDEITNEFYFDRDYKGGSGGSGGSGSSEVNSKTGLTLKQEVALIKKIGSLMKYEDFKPAKQQSNYHPLSSLFSGSKTATQNILKTKKLKPVKLAKGIIG